MNDRRKALVGRFRASSQERIRKLTLKLLELESGRASAADVQEIGRELHTLKGESRMLDFGAVSEVAHEAEALLSSTKVPGRHECDAVISALEVVSRFLRGELGGEEAGHAALGEAAARLAAATATATSATATATATAKNAGATGGGAAAGHGGTTARSVDAAAAGAHQAAAADGHPAAAGGGTPSATTSSEPLERWIQVNAARIDEMSDRLGQFNSDFRALNARLRATASDGMSSELRTLVEDFDRCRSQLDDLTGASWALRLVPVEPMFAELLQHARQLAASQGKRLRIAIQAAGALIERTVLDELREPLVHLVRNAVDHGIELPGERRGKPAEATLTLRAEAVGANVVLTISDDGCGIDPERVRSVALERGLIDEDAAIALPDEQIINLIFQHGFSTRSEVTELSGRGVGLDVVRSAVEKVGGTLSLASEVGQGTRMALSIPTRLSQERALVVDCAGTLYGFASRNVLEVVKRSDYTVERVAGGDIIHHRDGALPLRSLSTVLARRQMDEPWVLILVLNNRKLAYGAPSLLGEHELVRHAIDPVLASVGYLGASATLEDGRLVLLVASAGLLRQSELKDINLLPAPLPAARRTRVLVVDDSPVIRELVSQVLRAAGCDVENAGEGRSALAKIEASPPDLVIADVEMPIMDGFELLRRVRARSQHLPFVLLTSRGSADDRQRAVALGANAHLIKSGFQESTLLDTVRRFVDLPE
jgi:two-component system chemotaxis sensor kinase CheA/two-component system sensor histidine kinase and response regulator WspE